MPNDSSASWKHCAAAALTEASLDTSVFRRHVHPGPDDPDYGALTRGVALALTYFVDAELEAIQWRGSGEQGRAALLRARCLRVDNPNARTKQHFVRAKRAHDALGFSPTQRNQTDLWIIAQTAEYGMHLVTHDRLMVRVAAAIGVPVATLLPDIEPLLAADDRRLTDAERRWLRR